MLLIDHLQYSTITAIQSDFLCLCANPPDMEHKLPKIKHLETFHLRDFNNYNIITSFPYHTVTHYLHGTIDLKSVVKCSKEEDLKYLLSIHTFICSLISKGAVNIK